MDGTHGLMIASIASFGSFLKYAKQWELAQKHKESFRDLPETDPKERGFR